ncbi:MAG: hypothetical protein ACI8WB_000347 [Phenylobacterium sp.]
MIKDLAMQRVMKWLLFGVICGLLPIGFVALDYFTVGEHFQLRDLIGKGELLLISCGISATGMGELLVEGTKYVRIGMVMGACSVILVGGCSYWFASVGSSVQLNIENITIGSLGLFLFSVAITAGCFIITEEKPWLMK